MKTFIPKVWNRLEYSKLEIAAEITPLDRNNRRWIGIYPAEMEGYKYKVVEIELPKEIIEGGWDWAEENENGTKRSFIKDEAGLFEYLRIAGVDPDSFDVPWKFQYPL